MKIFILAGGFGTRLQSVVYGVPKPMAPILNKPFLEYQINEIKLYYPDDKIYLLTHYLSEVIEDYFKDDTSISILKEEKPLGTGGSIKNAINELQLDADESVFVFNGDTYIKPDLEKMMNNSKIEITILGSFQKNCDRYGTFALDNDEIVDFNEKKIGIKNAHINAGCYCFKDLKFFNQIKEKEFSIEEKFKEYLLNHKMGVFRYNGIFIDIGIPEDYSKMINYIKERSNASR